MLKAIFSPGKIKSVKLRILLWATTLGVLCGAVELGNPLEYFMQSARDAARNHPVSGDIVVAGIDNETLRELGPWPWTAEQHAQIVDRLNEAGVRRIFFNYDLESATAGNDLRAIEQSFARSRAEIYLPSRFETDPRTQEIIERTPSRELRANTQMVNVIFWIENVFGVRSLPYAKNIEGRAVPSLAAALSGQNGAIDEEFQIDFAIRPQDIPHIGVAHILSDDVTETSLQGKDILIGPESQVIADRHPVFGQGRLPEVMIHATGAETLKAGRPVALGWLLPLMAALGLAVLLLNLHHRLLANILGSTGLLALLAGPLLLESMSINLVVVPALLLLMVTIGMKAWHRHNDAATKRGLVNAMSGLPNLNALRQSAGVTDHGLVAARVQNYVEVTTALSFESEQELARQIASRLSFGTGGSELYHGDEGLFLWLVPLAEVDSVGDQLIALNAIFQSALLVGDRKIDLTVSFGVDVDAERELQNRIAGAMYAAQEAFEQGEKWKIYDSSKLEATEWKISMLGEMDAAIDNDEIWVAYQPKLDLKTGLINGAEALVRWNHPEKGPINPGEFVQAAEKHNRIEKLTQHVLDRAVAAALSIITRDHNITMSVNLSSRMIGHADLEKMVRGVSEKYGLPLDFLMLEITETAAMSNTGAAMEQLERLREIGVRLSIDDYGTGYSTLEYLKRCPASELKIDRSFISNLTTSRSDRIMVNSTIELAHSLGQTVVAEGIEDSETLDALKQMGCDTGQGFLIGRPMDLAAFTEFIDARNSAPQAAHG